MSGATRHTAAGVCCSDDRAVVPSSAVNAVAFGLTQLASRFAPPLVITHLQGLLIREGGLKPGIGTENGTDLVAEPGKIDIDEDEIRQLNSDFNYEHYTAFIEPPDQNEGNLRDQNQIREKNMGSEEMN